MIFEPKILSCFKGYNRTLFTKDVFAGLTVGVVALPLAMAFAIASGLKPEAGIFTAIIAGGLISLLGGSRVQIGGPAGAFIVIVYGIVDRYGVANLLLATAMSMMDLPVDTIGSRFGGIPSGLPHFQWIPVSWDTAQFVIMPALTLALLGSIESLLCARVADGMIHDRHHPNQELMAQGIANLVSPFFGGMPATGTIARTVTNVQSGGSTPIAGIVHAVTLLLVILFAAPLAKNVPLANLAAILMYVAWNMGEWSKFFDLKQFRLAYRLTMLSVFGLTIILDLTVAVEIGLLLAFITFIYRISSLSRCEAANLKDFPVLENQAGKIDAYRIYGAIFFGAVQLLESIEKNLPSETLILDLKNVIYVDASGMDTIMELKYLCDAGGIKLIICGLAHQPHDVAERSGLLEKLNANCLYPDLSLGIQAATKSL